MNKTRGVSISTAILATSGGILLCFAVLYSRSWPFFPLTNYDRTQPIEINAAQLQGRGLVLTKVGYRSNQSPVLDPIVAWEVRRYAREYLPHQVGPTGEMSAVGTFVESPCPSDVWGWLRCRKYEWVWLVPSFPQSPGAASLATAVAAGDIQKVEAMVRAGEDVNKRDFLGRTAIWSAHQPEIARILVNAGASVEAPVEGYTALMGASSAHDLIGVRTLLAVGANPNAKDDLGRTPLLYALHLPLFRQDLPSTQLVDELVNAGANVNARDKNGVTPLMSAVSGGWPDIVKLLLAAHADMNEKDKKGATALSLARTLGQAEIVRLLTEKKGPSHTSN